MSQINENGTFTFRDDAAFDPANPRTYPERFSIRTGAYNEFINNHTYEAFAQDKWRVSPKTTLSPPLLTECTISNRPAMISPGRNRTNQAAGQRRRTDGEVDGGFCRHCL